MDTAFTVALTTSPIAFAAMRVRRAMGVATFAAFGGDAIAAGPSRWASASAPRATQG